MSRRRPPRALRWAVRLLRPPLMVLTRRDWRGAEKLPTTGYVLAPNHISHLDPILLGHFMVDHDVVPRYLAKDSLFAAPVIGRLMRAAEQIPVHRSSGGAAESLRSAVEAVRDGQVVTIYPEGTITRDPDLWPMAGRTGAVRVALETGLPLVPLAQWGAHEILAPYTRRPRLLPRKTIHVRVGDPIDLSDLVDRPLTEAVLHEATDRLVDALTAMVGEIRGALPQGPRHDVRTVSGSRPAVPPVDAPRADDTPKEP